MESNNGFCGILTDSVLLKEWYMRTLKQPHWPPRSISPQILAALPYEWSGGRLLFFSCLRVVFIPLFVMCVYPASAPTLSHPAWPCLLSLLMGVTNGYFGSVPMIQAAGKVPPEQRELAGENFLSLCLSCTSSKITKAKAVVQADTGMMLLFLVLARTGPRIRTKSKSNRWFTKVKVSKNTCGWLTEVHFQYLQNTRSVTCVTLYA